MTRRDCACPRARHVHGTQIAYVKDRCRCDPCRSAATAAHRARTRQQAYGRYHGLVDAQPVRDHIAALSAVGIGLKTITARTGVSGGQLTSIVYGRGKRGNTPRPPQACCRPDVRDRVLAIPLDAHLAAGARVDSTGTHRRLRALVAVGWSQSKLAHELGMARGNFGKTMRSVQVEAGTERAVRDLYERLWDRLPPRTEHRDAIAYSRAQRHARVHGWPPPLAWDDDTIDDPYYRPARPAAVSSTDSDVDEVAVSEAIAGRRVALTRAERAEAVRIMTARGYTARDIAERLGQCSRTIQRSRAAA